MECQLCLEIFSVEKIIFLPCTHKMCKDCHEKYVEKYKFCPTCRTPFSVMDDMNLYADIISLKTVKSFPRKRLNQKKS